MKEKYLGHGVWALVAIGAFVFGSQRDSGKQGGSENNRETVGTKSARAKAAFESGSREGRRSGRGEDGLGREKGGRVLLSDSEIQALGEKFRKGKGPIEKRLAFSKLLEGLTPENALLMREQIAHLNHDSAEFREFHYAWGAIAGGPAIINGANTPKRDMAASLAGWASADPQAAKAWFEGVDLANDPDFSELVGERGMEIDGLKSHLLIGMVYGLSDNNPYAAADFVVDLAAEGHGKASWMMGMITDKVLNADGPQHASLWVSGLPAGEARAGAVSKVAQEFSKEDPTATVRWLDSIPETQDKIQGLRTTFSNWAGEDSQQAGEYLSQMEPSVDRDWAVSGYAPRLARDDIGAAIDWVNAMSDPKVQEKALIQTAQVYYHRVDKEAAREWLPTTGLSEEAQKMVINPKRR